VKRAFRLAKSTDFERVRSSGKSFPHPLLVLLVAPNDCDQVRIGVAAGRSLGCAVKRNRAKRLLRASIEPLAPGVAKGWDVILLARRELLDAGLDKIRGAMELLLKKAGLL
jgi:ribonuclease P protein component